jgi:hypothetical protein
MPTTPLQIVKEQHGAKDQLIARVAAIVEPNDGESPDEHKRRLRNVSNRKLLHLLTLGTKVQQMGGRERIVKRILELKGQPKDHEYGDKLKKLSFGRLVDMVGSLERRAKKTA